MHQDELEVHLSDYLRIIKNRKSDVIIFFFTTVFIVAGFSFMMQPSYRATVSLLVDEESPDVLTTTGLVALDNTNYYAYKEYLQSQKEIIKSRSIAHQVFKKLKLEQNEDYISSKTPIKVFLDWVRNVSPQGFEKLEQAFEKLELDRYKSHVPDKDPIKIFLKTIKVESLRDTRLLLLHVDNKNPHLAARLANSIAEVYVARNLSYITKREVLNLLKNEYLKLQTKISEYSKIYKHKHPKMIRLKQEIEQMATRIKQEKKRAVHYDFMQSSSSLLKPETSGSIFTGLKANNIIIQDRAEVPKVPLKPNIRLNILLAMLVGLCGGIGLAFFFEYLDNTVNGFEDVKRLVQWPFLGNVPRMNGLGINGLGKMGELKKSLFTQIKPNGPVSEAYRAIRTSVLFSSTEEYPLKSIIITSPGPQEGKTTTLCNLGIAMAQSQRQVLLVDADMRKSRLHEIFKGNNEIGLSSFLSGQVNFADLVQKTEIDNLFLVSSGPQPPNPSELLTSRKMKEFIESVKTKFDFILFDTPPVAVVTDAAILSQVVDGTIIVLESGRTNIRLLPRTHQVLKDARARIIGSLLNKISPAHNSYYDYKNYYRKTK